MVSKWCEIADSLDHIVPPLHWSPWNNRRAIKIRAMGRDWGDLPPRSTGYDDHNADLAMWMKMAPALRDGDNDRFLVPAPFSTAR